MRVAPLAFVLSGESREERTLIRDVCRITHKNDEAYVAALAVVRALHRVRRDQHRGARLLTGVADDLPDTRVRDALRSLAELPDAAPVEEAAKSIGTSGHAAESVPLAIYLAARYVTSCEEAILAAVRCGGDTDTTASIAGQICGAAGGTIPEPWIARLPVRDEIEELSEQLAAVSRGEALHR